MHHETTSKPNFQKCFAAHLTSAGAAETLALGKACVMFGNFHLTQTAFLK